MLPNLPPAPRKRFASYRQWKAWRASRPAEHERRCVVCSRELSAFDGLQTRRVIGGKAAAFGGVGLERTGFNPSTDRIKAGCTVKFKELVEEKITPAHRVTVYGMEYEIAESVERKYQDRLMTVSVSGIGCEICRYLSIETERGYIDVSEIVREMDPDDAPPQEGERSPRAAAVTAQPPIGIVGVDHIRRPRIREDAAALALMRLRGKR